MRILAQLALRYGENDQAEFLLSQYRIHPHLHDIRLEYIEVLKSPKVRAGRGRVYLVTHAPGVRRIYRFMRSI